MADLRILITKIIDLDKIKLEKEKAKIKKDEANAQLLTVDLELPQEILDLVLKENEKIILDYDYYNIKEKDYDKLILEYEKLPKV